MSPTRGGAMMDTRCASLETEVGRCPGCGRSRLDLPADASFCPACGRRLRTARQIAWTVARRLWRRERPAVADPAEPRSPVVVGYGNALWRLGWRYEHGRGVRRNVPEAMRCYRKSAGLGNVEARARLDVPAPTPLPVVERADVTA